MLLNTFVTSALSVTTLFTGALENEITENINIDTNSTYNLVSETNKENYHNDAKELLYMEPAKEESSKLKERRKKVVDELEARMLNQAKKEQEKKIENERERLKREWEESYPQYDNSPQGKFINTISKDSMRIAHEYGIYPSVMIAQAGHESNWGRSGLARNYNNLMGTKGSWKGKSTTMRTGEHVNGKKIYINAGFSVYDSWTDSLERYGGLIRNGLKHNSTYYSGAWRSNAKTYKDATAWLQGRYATDHNYASKVNRTIEKYNLDRFDDIKPIEEELKNIDIGLEIKEVNIQAPDGIYEVQKGDSLYSIALTHDLTINELIELNDMDKPRIEEKQWLLVHGNPVIQKIEDLLDEDKVNQKNTDGLSELNQEALNEYYANK